MSEPVFTRRHWGREVIDAVLWPLSMLTSKHKGRGRRDLSAERVLLVMMAVLVWRVLDGGGHFTTPDVWVVGLIVFALIVETLFMNVPVREGLAALTAIFGAQVAKRTRTVSIEEEVETPTPPDHPEPEEPSGDTRE